MYDRNLSESNLDHMKGCFISLENHLESNGLKHLMRSLHNNLNSLNGYGSFEKLTQFEEKFIQESADYEDVFKAAEVLHQFLINDSNILMNVLPLYYKDVEGKYSKLNYRETFIGNSLVFAKVEDYSGKPAYAVLTDVSLNTYWGTYEFEYSVITDGGAEFDLTVHVKHKDYLTLTEGDESLSKTVGKALRVLKDLARAYDEYTDD